jgi:hypothetical protein
MIDKKVASIPNVDPGSMGFPDLRIVSREDLLLHEEMDTQRQIRLIDRISSDGLLRNPPVVASLSGSHRYLLLDGANRVSALDYLAVRHLMVQVEDYRSPNLVLSHWNHVVRDVEAETIIDMVASVPGVLIVKERTIERLTVEGRHYLCSIRLDGPQVFHVFGGSDVSQRVRLLRKISNLYYHGIGRIDRVSHTDSDTLKRHHRNFGALIIYRDLSKDEVREAAETGNCLPSGLTRFLIPRRVLGFNFSLDLMKSSASLEEKQRRLEEAVQHKVEGRKVRYYEEPTFVFDD